MYKIDNVAILHQEKDNFENGCDPDTSRTFFLETSEQLDKQFFATFEGLSKALFKAYNISPDECLLDSCEELGRLDIQYYSAKRYSENFPTFARASAKTIEQFKKGEKELFLINLSFYIESDLDDTGFKPLSLGETHLKDLCKNN